MRINRKNKSLLKILKYPHNYNYCSCGKIKSKYSATCKDCQMKYNNPNKNGLKGKNNPNYKDGRTLKKYYCIDCLKKGIKTEITWQTFSYGTKKCISCFNKGRKNPMFGVHRFGKKNPNYKDGITLKKYYCKCGREIAYSTFLYGGGKCRVCSKLKNNLSNITLKKRRLSSLNHWKNKDYRDKTIKAIFKSLKIKPNKPEKVLGHLLNLLFPKEYNYVGDGQVILGGFNPDFINCNGQKKIVELYGDYWHNLPNLKKRDRRRLREYTKLGYKTLIVWEKELKNIDKLTNKLEVFNK